MNGNEIRYEVTVSNRDVDLHLITHVVEYNFLFKDSLMK